MRKLSLLAIGQASQINIEQLPGAVLTWVAEALRQSHEEQRRFHEEAVARLQAEYNRLQNRIDTMYVDKLDRLIDATFFERKASEWRVEQDKFLRSMEEHRSANQSYLSEGIRLLEISHRVHELFQRQAPRGKRKLLDFVLSNCTWKNGSLSAEFRQPFDMLVVANIAHQEQWPPEACPTATLKTGS